MLNAVVDLSHHNTINNFAFAQQDGITGLIHKATQGLSFVDKMYKPRRDRALELGFLWGAYHFGEGGDPIGQAEHFLNVVQPDSKTLLAIDFEGNPDGPTMSLAEAEQLVDHIHSQTGRWPVVYTSRSFMNQAANGSPAPLLSQCPLWVASYLDAPALPKQWDKWTFWQYTNGVNGPEPRKVKGIVRCDRNQFNGSADDLKALWNA